MPQITIDELMSKMASPDTPESELAKYFEIDESQSTPFAPKFRLNPGAVEIAPGPEGLARSAFALNSANWLSRMRRRRQYYDILAGGYRGPIIVSEGDSWWQYPLLLKDTIDHLMTHFAVYSMGAAGDLLADMAEKQEHLKGLEETGASILLLSGGGNDLLANGALATHLEAYNPDYNTGDYLKRSFQDLLDSALAQYERILRQVHGAFPHVSVFCHGYDYPVPTAGRWLGLPMASRNINDPALQKAIAAEMMDRFNRGLRTLCSTMPHVTYVDCRRVVRDDRWYDELHPTDEGFGDVAEKFAREIRILGNVRSGPMIPVSGPFGSAATLARMTPPMPAVAPATTGRGMSLHVGLNSVDPGHYAGWSGTLLACENDALAMTRLAERQGFATTTLLTQAATREAVLHEIKRAAGTLEEGDMFLFSISSHGAQIPDFNNDELDDGDQPKDETLCLYNFQVADDELYYHWGLFKPGVRILMVADCCHSGSIVRFNPLNPFAPNAAPLVEDPRVRTMPRQVERDTVNQNFSAYQSYAEAYAGISEKLILNPVTSPVAASVLSISACQDDQQAMDGDAYGAFTGALLKVWDGARFRGDYTSLRDGIDLAINSDRQTPRLFDKLVRDRAFVSQVPFTLFTNPMGTVVGSKPAAGSAAAGPPPVTPGAGAPPPPPPPADGPAPFAGVNPTAWLVGDEGEEADETPTIDSEASGGRAARDAAALAWPDYPAFKSFIETLDLRWFAPHEFLALGGAHAAPGACRGTNSYPHRVLWPNIANTAKVLDALRERLDKPIHVSSAYRSPAYNGCVGGEPASLHTRFNAIDFTVPGMDPADVAIALRYMRDKEKAFSGGIGRYATFVHVDTRGHDATWPAAFKNQPLPSRPPLSGGWQSMGRDERVAHLREVALAPRQRGTPRVPQSAFALEVPRAGTDFDPSSEVAAHQQELKAAVSANSVISFVENLTPGQKEDVLLSTLFAQRAADAKHDPIADREGWYRTYIDTLGVMGWTRESAPFESHQDIRTNSSLDQVAISALSAIASQNQIAIIKIAIDALRGLVDTDGAIRLFDFETSQTEGGHFQIGTAEATGTVVSMALGAFNFTYADKRRNILFVSWGAGELKFWLAAERIALSPSIYADVRDIVRERLGETRKTLITAIDLG